MLPLNLRKREKDKICWDIFLGCIFYDLLKTHIALVFGPVVVKLQNPN